MMKRMILALLLGVCILLLCACTTSPQLSASEQALEEPGAEQEPLPETKPFDVKETASPETDPKADVEQTEQLPAQTAAPAKPTQKPTAPSVTPKPTVKPDKPSQTNAPRATLTIVVPTLAPSQQPEATPKPTVAPTRKPESTPKPTTSPTEAPLPTTAPTEKPTETPQPEQPQQPASSYTDATHLCSAFMDAINTEKAANGAVSGSLDSGLCSIAQDRARQMAQACKASHIGSGYAETVGAMGSEGGATNRGRNSVHHSPQLMDCTSFGVGVAIGSDGMYYYSIIGQ